MFLTLYRPLPRSAERAGSFIIQMCGRLAAMGVLTALLFGVPAQARKQVDYTNTEIGVSLGTTAYYLDIDVLLNGVPDNVHEFRAASENLFYIKPNTVILSFPSHEVFYDGLARGLVLTEDGIWGLAPLKSRRQFSYFLGEETLNTLAEAHKRNAYASWIIVTETFQSADPRIWFTEGEIAQIDTSREGGAVIVLDSSVSFMASKVADIDGMESDSIFLEDGADGSLLAIRTDNNQVGKFEPINVRKLADFIADKAQNEGDCWFFCDQYRHFKAWPKVIRLHRPTDVNCQMTITRKEEEAREASGSLEIAINSDGLLAKLKAIGIGLEATASIKFTSTSLQTTLSKISGIELASDFFVVSQNARPTIVAFGFSEPCEREDNQRQVHPVLTAPGFPGDAVDLEVVQSMNETMDDLEWKPNSGRMQVQCFADKIEDIESHLGDLELTGALRQFFIAKAVVAADDTIRC